MFCLGGAGRLRLIGLDHARVRGALHSCLESRARQKKFVLFMFVILPDFRQDDEHEEAEGKPRSVVTRAGTQGA